jgi:alanine dehydrogenase
MAQKLLNEQLVKKLRAGPVLIDVPIEQGGCFVTSKATAHSDPTYLVDDVVHCRVANMPGAVGRTSTYGLNKVTEPFTLAIVTSRP